MKDIKVLGIDLAKNIFQIHGANKKGECVLRKRVSRKELLTFIAKLNPCTIGIEACGGSHYWARKFEAYGHTVKMMAPQHVKPYVKSNKTDRNDAEAIAEAIMRPGINFVPIKNLEQQDMQLVHRVREMAVKQRTMLANQMRGLLAEYGVILAKGLSQVRKKFVLLLSDEKSELTERSKKIFHELYERFLSLDEEIKGFDKEIEALSRSDERCVRLMEIGGIGPITATYAVSSIGDGSAFKNGREFSAWIGLVPRQSSSGNKTRLLGISKRGDKYFRTMLIHGARSVVLSSTYKEDHLSQWINRRRTLGGSNKAAVALANKNARTIWAMISTGERYRYAAGAK